MAKVTINNNLRARAADTPEGTDNQVSIETRALLSQTRDLALYNRVIQLQNVVAAMLESVGNAAAIRTAGIAAAAAAFPQDQTADSSTHFPNTTLNNRRLRDVIENYKSEVAAGDHDNPPGP